MTRSGFGLGIWLMGSAALVQWACTSSTEPLPIENGGGQGDGGTAGGGEGGASGQAGQGGNADVGGEAGGGGVGGESCPPKPLDCAPHVCPESAGDIDLAQSCGPYEGVDRYASDCGGVVIRVYRDKDNHVDYFASEYSFDAAGKLIGYAFGSDVAYECPTFTGTPCAPVGVADELCGEGGAGGQGGQAGAGGYAGAG